jgi:hypothetical protein
MVWQLVILKSLAVMNNHVFVIDAVNMNDELYEYRENHYEKDKEESHEENKES